MFEYEKPVIFMPEGREYDFAYYSKVEGKAVIYESGERNMQDSFAVDVTKLCRVPEWETTFILDGSTSRSRAIVLERKLRTPLLKEGDREVACTSEGATTSRPSSEYPSNCDKCRDRGMTWGCLNGDMPCPWNLDDSR